MLRMWAQALVSTLIDDGHLHSIELASTTPIQLRYKVCSEELAVLYCVKLNNPFGYDPAHETAERPSY